MRTVPSKQGKKAVAAARKMVAAAGQVDTDKSAKAKAKAKAKGQKSQAAILDREEEDDGWGQLVGLAANPFEAGAHVLEGPTRQEVVEQRRRLVGDARSGGSCGTFSAGPGRGPVHRV